MEKKVMKIILSIIFILVGIPLNYSTSFCQTSVRGLDPSIDISQYVLDVWTIENGLPHNTVDAIYQTREGYIWVGTFGGLALFDGVHFTVYDKGNTDGIKHNHISTFCEDVDGNLWIGTNGGGLNRYCNGVFESFTTANGLSSDFIRSLAVDKEKRLWVGTEGGGVTIIDFRSEQTRDWKYTHYTMKTGLSDDIIRTFCLGSDGSMWIGTGGGGLCRWNKGHFTTYTKHDGLADNTIFSLYQDTSGSLWIGTGNGLSRFRDNKFTNFTTRDGLSSNVIRSLVADAQHTLWIGTDGGGINRFRPESQAIQFSIYSVQQGLSNNFIRTMHYDREGSIWVGTRGGINRLSQGKFTNINTTNGLSDNFARSVLEDRDGNIWIGTNGGGLNMMRNGIIRQYTVKDGLSNNYIRSLFQDSQGIIWIGTDGGGLNRLDAQAPSGKQFTLYSSKQELDENFVRAICGDEKGLWIGTYGGGLVRFEDGKYTKFTTGNGLSNNFVFSLLKDNTGGLWIGTNGGGVNFYHDGSFKAYTTKDGLSSDFIFCIYEDSDGVLWIGTNGGGLNRYSVKDGKITQILKRHGLYDDVILEIVEDNLGNFWIGTDRGIFRVRKNDLNSFADGKVNKITCESYGRRDGMRSAECSGASQPAAWKLHDGRLFFPTLGGVVIINPADIRMNRLPPSLVIEQFIADEENIPIKEKMEISPGRQKFEIHYAGLSYVAPEKVQFRYRLEGFDKDWVSAGNRRSAYYTNIPPGKYVFRVIACNNDGIWNTAGASLQLRLKPFFYQTVSFYLVILLVIVVSVFVMHWMRVRYLRHKAEALSKLVDDRTKELQETKEQIEHVLEDTRQARDLLAESNKALALVNKDKTDLLNIVAHDLKNRLVTINSLASIIISNAAEQNIVKEKSDLIQISSGQTLELIKDLLDSAALETGIMELKKKPEDLTRIAEQVILHIKPQLDKKEQKLLVNFAPKGECIVEGDEHWLKEAIYNLLSNAHKFSPRGTDISVSVRVMDNEARFDVQDQGPGLTEIDKLNLFERFQRLSARPTNGETTSGLGLAIVKKCIVIHEGRVWAESELGKGSTFSFTLPLKKKI
ncbi:MAG: ATP-binding protein [Ignavibacteriales bacterium]|nr:ATP-binding protein [Ignavibacteriales bacterium]